MEKAFVKRDSKKNILIDQNGYIKCMTEGMKIV